MPDFGENLRFMTLGQGAFLLLAAIAMLGAGLTVTLRNLTHSVLSLILFFFGIAGLFFLLRADFIGAIQILVYVGAVAVLILFAIVLTRQTVAEEDFQSLGGSYWTGALGLVSSLLVLGMVLVAIRDTHEVAVRASSVAIGSVEEIGTALMTTYVMPFEVISILLTAALIGSVVIAMEEIQKRREQKR